MVRLKVKVHKLSDEPLKEAIIALVRSHTGVDAEWVAGVMEIEDILAVRLTGELLQEGRLAPDN